MKLIQDEKIHKEVIEKLKERDSFSADLLDDLREERIKADYYLNESFKYEQGIKCAKISEIIMNKVRSL